MPYAPTPNDVKKVKPTLKLIAAKTFLRQLMKLYKEHKVLEAKNA